MAIRIVAAALTIGLVAGAWLGVVYGIGYGAHFIQEWQRDREAAARAERSAKIPPAIDARLEEAAKRCVLITEEAMRRFGELPEEEQTALLVEGTGWDDIEKQVAGDWGWSIAQECEPFEHDPIILQWLDR